MKRMLIFWEMCDSSMSSRQSFPKLHTIQFTKCSFRNTTHFTQKYGKQHDLPIHKGVTLFARTAPSWKHAFPGTPGMHTIELMVHNQNTHHKLAIAT